jgi:integrase
MAKQPKIPKIRFNLKNKADDSSLIILMIIWQGERIAYSTGEKIKPAHWDLKKHRANLSIRGATEDYKNINSELDRLEKIAIEVIRERLGAPVSANELKEEIDRRYKSIASKEIPSFFDFLQKFISEQQTKADAKRGTWKKYITVQTHLLQYASEKLKRPFDYKDFDWRFKSAFIDWLYSPPRNHSINNAAKIFSIVKQLLRESNRLGYHENKIFDDKNFTLKKVKTKNKVRLTFEELDAMTQLDLSGNERLERVRDLFIVGSFTGLRHSDWYSVRREQIFTGKDGKAYIRLRAQKTSKSTVIPLFPELKEVLERYDYQLPKISQQKFNDYVKEVCQIALGNASFMRIYSEAGKIQDETIEKWQKVSSHAARRSFATNFWELGISPAILMTITGHATEKQFFEYIDVTNEEIAARFAEQATEKLAAHRAKVKRMDKAS